MADDVVFLNPGQAPFCRDGFSANAGHRITVYRKQPDGRWLLARDAHTHFEAYRAGTNVVFLEPVLEAHGLLPNPPAAAEDGIRHRLAAHVAMVLDRGVRQQVVHRAWR